jgi:hypothetical protein
MPSSSSPHAFRYEPALCTLSEGQTLADWRRADLPRTGKARGRGALRTRVFGPRAAARRLSGR